VLALDPAQAVRALDHPLFEIERAAVDETDARAVHGGARGGGVVLQDAVVRDVAEAVPARGRHPGRAFAPRRAGEQEFKLCPGLDQRVHAVSLPEGGVD
jgi:hypothetical protein